MRNESSISTAAAVLIALAAACDGDTLATPRADSGVRERDGGLDAPLALEKGWTFTYQATLVRREGAREFESGYTVTMTIDSVQDNGSSADSTIVVKATGQRISSPRNWDVTAGFDSWVSALGPADALDRVGAGGVEVNLSTPPSAPAAPKKLPADRIFFLDMRRIDAIRSAFNDAHPGLGPSSVAPEQHPDGFWSLSLQGMDPAMVYYPAVAKKRSITIEYNPRGFLERITENLGDSFDQPHQPWGAFRLTLTSTRP